MTRQQIEKEILERWNKSYGTKGKFYQSDLTEFRQYIAGKNLTDLTQQLHNMRCLQGADKFFNAEMDKLEKQLDKAGMYDMGNMKPENCLD